MRSALPPYALTVVEGSNSVYLVRNGVDGYFELDCHFEAETEAREFADHTNAMLGVSHAQRMALTFGSMFGWHAPGAHPSSPVCLTAISLVDELAHTTPMRGTC